MPNSPGEPRPDGLFNTTVDAVFFSFFFFFLQETFNTRLISTLYAVAFLILAAKDLKLSGHGYKYPETGASTPQVTAKMTKLMHSVCRTNHRKSSRVHVNN